MPVVERRFILTKGPPWGFRLYLDNQDILTISKIRRHSPAENAKLRSGDQIISLNGKVTTNLSHAEAMTLVDTTFGTLDILISRFESTSTKILTFDNIDTHISDDIQRKASLNLIRTEMSPEQIKVPECTPEPEIRSITVQEAYTPSESIIRPSSPDVNPVPISNLINEYDISGHSEDYVPKKKQFADSSFYNDPYNLYPTAEEKITMARRVASSLYAPDNKNSKGASIFERQRKRAEKYTLQKEETNVNGFQVEEQKFDLAHWPEVMDRKEKSPSPMYRLGYSSGPPVPPPPPPPPFPNEAKTIQEFMEKVQMFPKAKHNNISPDVCYDIAAALHRSDSRGAQIFAKQKHRAEKWTLSSPETISPESILAAPVGSSNIFGQSFLANQPTKPKIVSLNQSQNQLFNSGTINQCHNLETPVRKPTHVIRRNSNQGPIEPLNIGNRLSFSTSSTIATVATSSQAIETTKPASDTKWKPVKFNIPQRA